MFVYLIISIPEVNEHAPMNNAIHPQYMILHASRASLLCLFLSGVTLCVLCESMSMECPVAKHTPHNKMKVPMKNAGTEKVMSNKPNMSPVVLKLLSQ